MMSSRRVRLPYVAVQPSLPHVVADLVAPDSTVAAEDCWVSCYAPGRDGAQPASVHGKIRLTEADRDVSDRALECSVREGALRVDMVSQSQFTVACPDLSVSATTVLFPAATHNSLGFPTASLNPTTQELPPPSFYRLATRGRRGGIETFALSSDGGRRVVIGGVDGLATVVDVVQQVLPDTAQTLAAGARLIKGKETALRGHVGDVTAAAFFPSNEVVLTASSDMTLRVFSALDGSSPRTLKGHSKRVTACHILASPSPDGPHKGRLVLSSSLDGTIRLWDVSTANNERTWTLHQPISKMLVLQLGTGPEADDDASDPLSGKVALAAHTDGTVSLVHLSGSGVEAAAAAAAPPPPVIVCRTSSPSPIDAISSLCGWVATASRNGVVSLFRAPLQSGTGGGGAGGGAGGAGAGTAAAGTAPVVEWSRTEGGSSILDVQLSTRLETGSPPSRTADETSSSSSSSFSVLVAPSDGLAYRAIVSPSVSVEGEDRSSSPPPPPPPPRVSVVEEFVGPDCEPATCVREDERGRVWISAGGTDGGLRVYERAE